MPLHQKVGLVLIMALGLLTMVMSIMRTVWIVSFYGSNSKIENYDETAIFTLAVLEGPMVIIMGCIPTLRSLMDHTSSPGSSIRTLFSKRIFGTRRKVEDPTVAKSPEITGAYLELELSNRELGNPNQGGNVRVCTTDFHSRNMSEDYLVEQGQVRKTEQFSVTYGPNLGVR